MAQSVVGACVGAGDYRFGCRRIDISSVMTDLEPRLMEMDLGRAVRTMVPDPSLLALPCGRWYICIFIVIYGRMIEIYLVTSVAPVPMAAMMGKPRMGRYGTELPPSPCWHWAFRRFSSSSAWQFMLCWCRTSLWRDDIIHGNLEHAWATPYCCALRCSKPAVSRESVFQAH